MYAAFPYPPATRAAALTATLAALTAALAVLATIAVLPALPAEAQQRPFTTEVALDVNLVGIAAVTSDGSRVAATVRSRRDRTDVDHQRFGDPTYISPVSTRLMVIDTRSGNRTWVHEDPAQLRGFAWSPDGERLAYFAVEAGEYRLRIFDARAGSAETVALGTDNEIASSSPLVWAPDASGVLLGLRPDGWAEEARAAFVALTEAPVIVQDSRNDFLAWDRVRNIAAQADHRACFTRKRRHARRHGRRQRQRARDPGRRGALGAGVFGRRLVRHLFDGHAHEDIVHAAGRDRVRAVPARPRGRQRARVAAGHRRGADGCDVERRARCVRVQ